MEEYLHFQQELQTKRSRPHWISAWKKEQPTSKEKRIECPSPGDLSEELYNKWLEIGSAEELEAYNKLGQNFRVSSAYAKSLIEPEKSLDEEFEKEVQKHIEDICEWKIQEIMDDYEDDLESKLLFEKLIETTL